MTDKQRISTRELVLMALLSAALTAGKMALAAIPNIEIVSLLLIIYALSFGMVKGVIISVIFTLTDCFIYGFNTWTVMYFVVWPVLVVITCLARPLLDRLRIGKGEKGLAAGQLLGYSVMSAIYGFAFGFMCAIIEAAFMGGSHGGYFKYLIAYWVSGLPFDALHCAGNFCVALVLFLPLRELFRRLKRGLHIA